MKKLLLIALISIVMVAGCTQSPTGQAIATNCPKCADTSTITDFYENLFKEKDSLMDKTLELVSYYTSGASACNSKLVIRNVKTIYNGSILIDYYNPGNDTKLINIFADDIDDNMPSTKALIGEGNRCTERLVYATKLGEKDRSLDLTDTCNLEDMEIGHIVRICILTSDSRQACLIERMKFV